MDADQVDIESSPYQRPEGKVQKLGSKEQSTLAAASWWHDPHCLITRTQVYSGLNRIHEPASEEPQTQTIGLLAILRLDLGLDSEKCCDSETWICQVRSSFPLLPKVRLAHFSTFIILISDILLSNRARDRSLLGSRPQLL